MTTFTLSATAYAKIKMHCFKFPHCEVTGILLANRDFPTEVTDAVPLFHQGNKLLPMVEVAFQQVQNVISNTNKQSSLDKNEMIVGYYEIPAHLSETVSISPFAQRIGDRINQTRRLENKDKDSKENKEKESKLSTSTLVLSMHNPSGQFRFFVKTNIENTSGNISYSDQASSQAWVLEEVRADMKEEYTQFEQSMMKNILSDRIHLELADFDNWLDNSKEFDFMNSTMMKLLAVYTVVD